MGTLTVAFAVGFKTEPQYLFVRALAFCDPWLQLADEPKIDIFFVIYFWSLENNRLDFSVLNEEKALGGGGFQKSHLILWVFRQNTIKLRAGGARLV